RRGRRPRTRHRPPPRLTGPGRALRASPAAGAHPLRPTPRPRGDPAPPPESAAIRPRSFSCSTPAWPPRAPPRRRRVRRLPARCRTPRGAAVSLVAVAGAGPYHDHRAGGVAGAVVAGGAEQETGERVVAAVPEHEQVGLLGGLDEDLPGVAVHDLDL